MLAGESLAFDDMRAVLERSGFVSDGHSLQRVLDVLKNTGLRARVCFTECECRTTPYWALASNPMDDWKQVGSAHAP